MRKNIFVAYAFTGIPDEEKHHDLGKICYALQRGNNRVWCSLYHDEDFQRAHFTKGDIYQYCTERQDDCDALLVFLKHKRPSKGIDEEVRKSLETGQDIIIAPKKGLDYEELIPSIKGSRPHDVLPWRNLDSLCKHIEMYAFPEREYRHSFEATIKSGASVVSLAGDFRRRGFYVSGMMDDQSRATVQGLLVNSEDYCIPGANRNFLIFANWGPKPNHHFFLMKSGPGIRGLYNGVRETDGGQVYGINHEGYFENLRYIHLTINDPKLESVVLDLK
jgi:hypothetical protein